MAYERHKTFSGKTQDILLAVKELAECMVDADLREAEIYLPFSDGDATIRMKR